MAQTDEKLKYPPREVENSSTTPTTLNIKKICGVCNKNEARYKCPRCFLPYCSLSCSTNHKSTHANDPDPSPPKSHPSISPMKQPTSAPRAGTVSAAGTKSPFSALENSSELQELFRRYPRLPEQLSSILSATLPPSAQDAAHARDHPEPQYRDYSKGGYGRKKKEPWSHDRGIEMGVQALARAREEGGVEGEGIREFSALVLRIVEGGEVAVGGEERREGWDAQQEIWREEVKESVRVVERLLKGEM